MSLRGILDTWPQFRVAPKNFLAIPNRPSVNDLKPSELNFGATGPGARIGSPAMIEDPKATCQQELCEKSAKLRDKAKIVRAESGEVVTQTR
jgi:hypothetical protein